MATSPLFGWEEPDDVDLVKDGAAAIRTLGNAIDTSMGDLLGGTTGQVLSKASNTNMDFTWVAQDDSNAIQNAIVDAKGDLIAASAADTPARLAVGNNGETLVADSSTSTGLRYQGNYAAGKNKVINGDFGIWQRGTTFSNPASLAYTADRFAIYYDGAGATRTISQQTFTTGTAPVAGYEGKYFYRYAVSVAGSSNTANLLRQYIEDVQTFAGQTATISFWAKAASALTMPSIQVTQNFGTGGSPSAGVDTTVTSSVAVTTSWQRFTYTVSVPSISGKTLGTGNNSALELRFFLPVGASTFTFDIWGVQMEAGSVATAFQTATGTIQGELAACQRYYYRFPSNGNNNQTYATGFAATTGFIIAPMFMPVTMRTTPTSIGWSNVIGTDETTNFTPSVIVANSRTTSAVLQLQLTVSGATQFRPYFVTGSGSAGFVEVNAEL